MKRTFLKVALLSSLMVSMPVAFTSCKDYDDEINDHTNAIGDLQTQVSALKDALNKANADIEAAKQAAAAASDAAAQAKAYADQAAAQAKADAIKAALDKCAELEGKMATQEQITDLASKIAAIETGLNTLSTDVDAVKSGLEQLKIQVAALENYKALVDKNTADIATINSTIEDLTQKINSIEAKLSSLTTADNLEAVRQELIQYVDKAISDASASVSKISVNLVTLLTTQLRSLVFIPSVYADGIEGVEYDYVRFYALTASAGNLTQANQNGKNCTVQSPGTDWNYSKSTNNVEIDPVNYISYHMNPASAVVKGTDLSFDTRDITNLNTRVEGVNPVVSADNVSTENGDLTVGYTVKGSLIPTWADQTPNNTTYATFKGVSMAVVAKVPNLNVSGVEGETTEVGTITSDYALIHATEYTPLALAYSTNVPAQDCPTPGNMPELWPTLKECIANAPSLEVQYNKSLELEPLIRTHYASEYEPTTHMVWTDADLEKYNLSYDFAPIQYIVDTNKTSDTQFIQQDLGENGLVTPCGVTAEGVADNTTTQASIGKNPIVRVRLVDNNGNVALVGFIKLEIKEEAKTPAEDIVIDPTSDLGSAVVGCNGWNGSVDWAYVTHYVLQKLNMSKDDFEKTYTIATAANDANFTDVNQYTYANGKMTQLTSVQKYGKVGLLTNTTGATTTVAQWSLTVADLQRIYEQDPASQTIYIKFEPKDVYANGPVYYGFTLSSVTKVEGEVVNKARAAWFRNGEVNLFNVPEPSFNNTPAVTQFKMNLNNAWYVGTNVQQAKYAIQGVNGADVSAYKSTKYYLTAANNGVKIENVNLEGTVANGTFTAPNPATATITLSVDGSVNPGLISGHNYSAANMGKHGLTVVDGLYEYNNAVLKAQVGSGVAVTIATLNQTTGELVYENNAISRALLNHFASTSKEGDNKADRTNAQLPISIGIVAWDPTCNLALKLTNGIYNGYFLRPINIASVEGQEFQDAHDNGSVIDIIDLLNFSDWRFFSFTGNNTWLFSYYGVKSVYVDVNNIKSNYANESLMAVNTAVNACFTAKSGVVSYPVISDNSDATNEAVAQAVREGLGTITWKNSDLNIQSIDVEIPIVVEYAWGQIFTTINTKVVHTYNKK